MASFELVVSRNNEDASWLEGIGLHVPVVLYESGRSTAFTNKNRLQGIRFHRLRNCRFNAYAFLYHVVCNYQHLSSTTIFAHAGFMSANPSLASIIDQPSPDWPELHSLTPGSRSDFFAISRGLIRKRSLGEWKELLSDFTCIQNIIGEDFFWDSMLSLVEGSKDVGVPDRPV